MTGWHRLVVQDVLPARTGVVVRELTCQCRVCQNRKTECDRMDQCSSGRQNVFQQPLSLHLQNVGCLRTWLEAAHGVSLLIGSSGSALAVQQLSSNGLLLVVSVDAGASTRYRAESVVAWPHLTDLGLLPHAWFCKKTVLAVLRARSENMFRAWSED